MPLVRIDAFEGRSDAEVRTLLDAVHRAVVKAVHIPERDRYQVYHAHPKGHFIVQDTGLAIPRTDKVVVITVFSKQREEILKRRLYKELTEELSKSSSIAPSDVMTCIVENTAADWSFGNGEPQFLTGELA
ncbi:MAG TPA: tautomerase family protein [Candidatus Acidoferrum sp.]|nr:tautomerase family protein [Candidatus Acidoferrum sp.]